MSAVVEAGDGYRAAFERLAPGFPGRGQGWLEDLRRESLGRFRRLGLPTEKDEEWRFTSVGPIAKTDFAPAPRPARYDDVDLKELSLSLFDAYRMVFVNGYFVPELSTELPPDGTGAPVGGAGCELASLARLLNDKPQKVKAHFASRNGSTKAFAALNTALFQDGAVIVLGPGAQLDKPVHLLFVSTMHEAPTMAHARVLVVAEKGARATIVEEYAGGGPIPTFTNVVTEVSAGEGSHLDYYRLQREGCVAFHVSSLQVRQGRDSVFQAHSISLGGALVRNDASVSLEAEGADCALNGLYLLGGRQHLDNHTVIDHATPHGTSRELYKGVLDGHARAVFDGSIVVRRAAQKTDARVYNKNLLLSEHGLVNTKPEFKINANDVQCKHGATIGQIPAEALFYLRSRGIGAEAARSLLIFAFASEMVDRVAIGPLREALSSALHAWLPETA